MIKKERTGLPDGAVRFFFGLAPVKVLRWISPGATELGDQTQTGGLMAACLR